MKKTKRMGLFTEGTITIHPLSREKVGTETFSVTVLTALLSCFGILLVVTGNLWDICLIWKLDWKNVWIIFWLLMSAGAVLLSRLSKKHRFVYLISVALLLLVGLFWHKELLAGAYKAVNAFLFSWNHYYGMEIPLFPTSVGTEWEITIFYLATWMCLYLSYLHGKRGSRPGTVLLVMIPILLGLIVGTGPNYKAFVYMLIGTLLLLTVMPDRRIERNSTAMNITVKNFIMAGGMFLIVVMVYLAVGAKVEGVLSQNHDKMLAYQMTLEENIRNTNLTTPPTLQNGIITNQKVVYTGKEIFRVTLDKKPDSILYFRGFVGDTYKNGIWHPVDENALLKEMDVWTPTPEKGETRSILNYSYQFQSANIAIDEQTVMNIGYSDRNENYAYIPYFADILEGSLQDKLYVQADSQIIRRMTCDSVQMHLVYPQKIEMKIPDHVDYNRLWENYSAYALKHYTLVTADGINRIIQLADSLRAEGNGALKMSKIGDKAYDKPIARVRKELFDTTTYSRNLDAVPIGEDVIENFLFDSKQGYCIHYASAATLLLRSLGVPTRYVEGYAIKPQDFKENDDGTYTAQALDYDGHAWAEIYSSVRGWIPVEVTKGSPGSGAEISDTSKDPSAIASEQAKKANAINNTPGASQANQAAAQTQKKSTKSGLAIDWKKILTSIVLYLLLAIVVVFLFYLLWSKTRGFRKRMYLRRYFASHDTRKVVLAFSYAVYQEFLHAGIVKDRHMWDDDYEVLLRKKLRFMNQDDLGRFIDCTKKTAFSTYQPTPEEVEESRMFYLKLCQAIQEGWISK